MANESSDCRPRAVNQSLQLSAGSSLLLFPKTPVSGEGVKRHELLQAGLVYGKILSCCTKGLQERCMLFTHLRSSIAGFPF